MEHKRLKGPRLLWQFDNNDRVLLISPSIVSNNEVYNNDKEREKEEEGDKGNVFNVYKCEKQ